MSRAPVRLYASSVAADLRLPLHRDPIDGVLAACEEKVGKIIQVLEEATSPCNTLSTACAAVANTLRTTFELIETDEDLERVRETYLSRNELGFTNLRNDLHEACYGLTIRLLHPEPWGMRYVSVIDCRGAKQHRRFYTQWHELAHLLIMSDQMRLVFRRTHEQRKNPEEQLVDLIAGRCGFHRALIQRHLKTTSVTFEELSRLRDELCPEASRQAAHIGFVNAWPTPCILLHAAVGFKAAEEREQQQRTLLPRQFVDDPQPVLRATHITANDAARQKGMLIFRNMRIPADSLIARVFAGDTSNATDVENLSAWEANGKSLPPLIVRITARRAFDGVEALLVPIQEDMQTLSD